MDFIFREEVEKAEKGPPHRMLCLDGLNLKDKYILVTTNFHDSKGDFVNGAEDIVKAYGPDNKKLPISVGTGFGLWVRNRNFREYGLDFDTGYGKRYGWRNAVCLDIDNSSGKKGFIAFCRGKNEFLPGALCEAYPEVRSFWLGMVKECLEAGVDGIDFRVEAHSTHTNDPFSYGFNEPIVKEYKKRYGVDIEKEDYDPDLLANLRGEFYTEFLRSASSLIRKAGKKMQVHINVDLMGPNPPPSRYLAYPKNIKFNWEKWISEGIPDEVTLRSCVKAPSPDKRLKNSFAQRVISVCQDKGIPIHFNRYIPRPYSKKIIDEINTIRRDGRFRSFILYEVALMMSPDKKGNVILRYGDMEEWCLTKIIIAGPRRL